MKRIAAKRLMGVVAALSVAIFVSGVPASAASGPYMVKNINPGFADSTPRWLTNMNDVLFFSAKGGSKGRELWRSDGTASGTYRVKDIRVGAKGSDPMALAVAGGLLYFSANDGVSGRELWASDGTGPGTRKVRDINPGTAGSDPAGFKAFDGSVYFAATDASAGRELWRTNGTANGTRRVKDIVPGPAGSDPVSLVRFAGKLFFLGACVPACSHFGMQTLYRTYGNAATTKQFKDLAGNVVAGWISNPSSIGGRLYYAFGTAYEPDKDGLWRTNGLAASTRKIASIYPNEITGVNGTAFINGGTTLWRSDGTAATTTPIKDIPMYSGFLFAAVGNRLFFDGESNDWFHALWVSDGTSPGTQPLVSAFTLSREWAAIGSTLYFANQVDDGYTLWRSDGTPTGTYGLGGQEAHMWDVTAVGNSIFWVSDAGNHGNELWRYVP